MSDAGNPAPRTSRWLKLALGLSLALNLAVVGMVAGALLRDGPRGRGVAVRDIGFGPWGRSLSEADRDAMRRAFIARAPDLRAARSAMREDMAQMATLLRADPFDPAALRAAMDRASARTAEMVGLGQSLIVERVEAMTPEARRAFADRLEADMTRRPGPRGEGRD